MENKNTYQKPLSGGFRILKVSEHHSASATMRLALARRYTQISEAISVPMSVRRGAAYIAEGALQGVLPESSPLKSQNAAKWIWGPRFAAVVWQR
jgi:hypothetical protein